MFLYAGTQSWSNSLMFSAIDSIAVTPCRIQSPDQFAFNRNERNTANQLKSFGATLTDGVRGIIEPVQGG